MKHSVLTGILRGTLCVWWWVQFVKLLILQFFFFPTFSCFLSLGIYAYILRILLPNVLDLCVPFTFGDLFLYYRKLQNFMTLYLFITSHNCGTTGRIYENGLYSQNMLNVSTVMTGTEMRMICRFASQFA
jgi:hypothetical protein